MRMRHVRRAAPAALVAVMAVSAAGPAGADEVRMKDGARVRATVVDRDATSVLLRIPRAEIATINGKPLPSPPAEGQEAPGFSVTDLAGGQHTIPDPSGRATLIKFWASWCPYCRGDIGLIKDLYDRYREQGLRILAISTDQDPEKLKAFVQEQQLPYPVVASAQQPAKGDESLPTRYEVSGIPAYFVIDRNGWIRKAISGAAKNRRQELEDALTAALQVARKAKRSSPPGPGGTAP